MPLGQYRNKVTLDVPNGANGYVPLDPPTWYCSVVSEGAGVATLIGHAHPGITQATRVHFNERLYHVVALVNVEERDAELRLSCTEVFVS